MIRFSPWWAPISASVLGQAKILLLLQDVSVISIQFKNAHIKHLHTGATPISETTFVQLLLRFNDILNFGCSLELIPGDFQWLAMRKQIVRKRISGKRMDEQAHDTALEWKLQLWPLWRTLDTDTLSQKKILYAREMVVNVKEFIQNGSVNDLIVKWFLVIKAMFPTEWENG